MKITCTDSTRDVDDECRSIEIKNINFPLFYYCIILVQRCIYPVFNYR